MCSRTSRSIPPWTSGSWSAFTVSVGVNPTDGKVWGSVRGDPGYVLRFDPKTKLSEIYEPPLPGYGPRGFDIDRNGISYVPLSS
jgi:hypothetical protein